MKVQIIIGSTRPGRVTATIAGWVAKTSSAVDGLEVEVVDLADYPMPFFDEPISPRYNPNRTPKPEVQRFIDKIAEAEAYIYVTPEYNHSTSAVLKNAIDYLTVEMLHKPAAVVSHGSVGGARAIVALKEILSESLAAIVPKSVAFIGHGTDSFDETGDLKADLKANPYGPQKALDDMLIDLKWYGNALTAART